MGIDNESTSFSKVKKLALDALSINILGSNVTKKDIALFCRQFYFTNKAGISITKSLYIIEKQTPNQKLKRAIAQVKDDIVKGDSVSDALGRFKIFPQLLVSMTAVGELSGKLSSVYEKLALYYEKDYKTEQEVRAAMVYPIAISFLTLFVVIIAVVYLVPNYSAIYNDNYASLPVPTMLLITISGFVSKNMLQISIIVFFILVGLMFFVTTAKGKYFYDGMLTKLPLVKNIYLKSINLRFVEVMSILLEAGYPIKDSLLTVKSVINNAYLNTFLDDMAFKIHSGTDLGTAIEEAGFFEPIMYGMVKVGEESGNIREVFLKSAEYFELELSSQISKLSKLVEPVMILVIGLILGFVMLAIMMPAFNLGNIL